MPLTQNTNKPINIFYSYAREDKLLRDKLEKHLSSMKREGLISNWHDQDIKPGQEWKGEINKNLKDADIILLLISHNFMASQYCFTMEMETALQRHETGEAWVIPIILRPVDWTYSPMGKLQALPYKGKPVTEWNNRDRAFYNIAEDLRRVVIDLHSNSNGTKSAKDKEEYSRSLSTTKKTLNSKTRHSLYKTLREARKKRSIGEKLHDATITMENNFSINGIKKRSQGYPLLLLFLFSILDIIILPALISQWLANPVISLSVLLISVLLFIMGVSNKNNAIAVFLAFTYCAVWTIIGKGYIVNHFHLNFSLVTVIVISALLSCLQLELFRVRSRRRLLHRWS